jgi:transposase
MDMLDLPYWTVIGSKEGKHSSHITAEYGIPLTRCPQCGSNHLSLFGKRSVLFGDLPYRGKHINIEAVRQRYKCNDCGKLSLQPLPDIDDKRNATRRLVRYVREQSLERTFVGVAKEVGLSPNTVKAIFDEYAKTLEAQYRPLTPEWLGISDIFAVNNPRYILTNVKERTIVDILPEHKVFELADRLFQLPGRKEVEVVVIGMSRNVLEQVQGALPQAHTIVDRWDIVRLADEALETVRTHVRANLTDKIRRKLSDDKLILSKRRRHLTPDERLKLQHWSRQFPLLVEAYNLKERFHRIYDAADKSEAIERYQAWLANITNLRIPFKPLMRAVIIWQDQIFSYFDYPNRILNGYAHSLARFVERINQEHRGYSFEALRAKILYTDGVRKHKPSGTIKVFKKEHLKSYEEDRQGLAPRQAPNETLDSSPKHADYGADIATLTRLYSSGEFQRVST